MTGNHRKAPIKNGTYGESSTGRQRHTGMFQRWYGLWMCLGIIFIAVALTPRSALS